MTAFNMRVKERAATINFIYIHQAPSIYRLTEGYLSF